MRKNYMNSQMKRFLMLLIYKEMQNYAVGYHCLLFIKNKKTDII